MSTSPNSLTELSSTHAAQLAAGAASAPTARKWLAALLTLVTLALGAWVALRPPGGLEGQQAGGVAAAGDAAAASGPATGLKPLSAQQLERMVGQAVEQTVTNPQDKVAWSMLAHSHEMLGQFSEATRAYARLAELAPEDAQVLADYADALGMVNGRRLQGAPQALIQRALALDGKNVKALMLSGALAMEQGDKAKAVALWQKARDASTDPRITLQIDQGLAMARAELAPPPASQNGAGTALALGPASAPAVAPAAAASLPRLNAGPAKLSGRVWLAPALVGKAPPDATVFIFARPANGSRMPVAVLRKQVKDLPLAFTLGEDMAMTPSITLANVEAAVVGARVSLRGDIVPQAGDLQGLSAPQRVGATGIQLEISEVLK